MWWEVCLGLLRLVADSAAGDRVPGENSPADRHPGHDGRVRRPLRLALASLTPPAAVTRPLLGAGGTRGGGGRVSVRRRAIRGAADRCAGRSAADRGRKPAGGS
ncbi:hypothetical protein SCOCK_120061 [Actinacidiphila cocklensis]|uniref:Uncharacterized protein n=1 Tax=Actinacidiphila cocklensis TaxID=887465 RepID=A0A9W4GNJ4_9ACTN|nr:hypothetical protein SCOCK_120061 [Actinacidiphila cocklensis]